MKIIPYLIYLIFYIFFEEVFFVLNEKKIKVIRAIFNLNFQNLDVSYFYFTYKQ